MSVRVFALLSGFLLALVVLSQSLFIVHAGERAVLLRFGQVVDADLGPGLHALIPLVDDARKFDMRTQVSDVETPPLLTADNNYLVLDTYAVWQVGDVQKFVAATGGNLHEADAILLPLLREAFKDRLAGATLHDLIAQGQVPVLGAVLPALTAHAAELGIVLHDVQVRRVQYAPTQQAAVYQRMSAVFKAEADGLRATAKAQSDQVAAAAEAERRQIAADARQQGEQIRGQGDGTAAAITARAAGSDPEFYRFFRSMEIYRQGLGKPQDVLVLHADDELMQYLKSPGQPRK